MTSAISSTVDLSRLAPPTIVEQLDYEQILVDLIARVQAELPSFDATIDSDPTAPTSKSSGTISRPDASKALRLARAMTGAPG